MSILLLTFIFGSCYINAYANFSKQEMSDLIELRDNKLLRYQVAYQTHIHRHEDAQIRKECEYAHDLGQSHKYLHENWIEPDDGINAKYAFSGDIGTTLILDQPDSRGRMWGTIVQGIPEYFAEARIPDWSGFRYLQEYGFETLSNALRNAKDVNIQKDTYGEEDAYRINFTLTGEKDQIEVEGKVMEFTRDGSFVAYVSPSKQFATVKIDLLRGPGSDDVIDSRVGTEFEEVSPGFWLPKRIDYKYVTITVKDLKSDVVLGDEAKVISKLDFPSKTYVEDKIAGLKYQVALSDEVILSDVKEGVETQTISGELIQASSLSTQDYLIVDDFESYNEIPEGNEGSKLIYLTWKDGYDNPKINGATFGYIVGSTLEENIVYGGKQSVPLFYDNTVASSSEVTVNTNNFPIGRDWTKGSPQTLVLWVHGYANNAATDRLYVKVDNSKVLYKGDISLLGWRQWNIDLLPLGIDLSNVSALAIGFERTGATGGSGVVLIDEIRLYQVAPIPEDETLNITEGREQKDLQWMKVGTIFGVLLLLVVVMTVKLRQQKGNQTKSFNP